MKPETQALIDQIESQKIAFYCDNRADYLKFKKALSYCGIEIPDRKEDNAAYFKNYPYFVIGCNRGIYAADCFDRVCYDWENIHNACNVDNVVTATDMIYENEVDDLQKFMDGLLIIEVNNIYEQTLLMNQLKATGIKCYNENYLYNENYPYYFMRPSLTHDNLMILETASNREYIKQDFGITKYIPSKYVSFRVIEEPNYKLLYEQAKAERDIAFSQLEALGTSFGEKEDAAKERMEGNVLHHFDSLIDRKKEEIIFRLNHIKGAADQSAMLMDEIKKASLETAEWLKQERTAKSMAASFENADAMLAVLNRGTALYNLDNGKYVWLYSEDGDVAVDNINALTANKIAKEAVEQSDYWEVFLPMGAQIYTKEEIKNFCEDNCHSAWITSEDYEKTLGLSRDMEQNKDNIERD